MSPMFSVLIPAYNAEKYIEECVHSCLLQDCSKNDIEIIIANDGSNDRTQDICEKISKQHNNVRVFYKKNEGLVNTRKFLYKRALGKYLLFLDADDMWESDFISTIRKAIENYFEPDIICFGFSTYKAGEIRPYMKGVKTPMYFSGLGLCEGKSLFLTTDKYNSICGKAIKKTLFNDLCFPQEWGLIRQGEDKLLTISLLRNVKSICVIPDYIYLYRIDNESMTRTFYPSSFGEMIFVDKIALQTMESLKIDSQKNRLQWAITFVNKFYDYMVRFEKAKEKCSNMRSLYNEYRFDDACDKALKMCIREGPVRSKTKALLLSNYSMFKLSQLMRIC